MRAALALLILAALTGCTTPADPRDPDIWRPTAPVTYPLPQ